MNNISISTKRLRIPFGLAILCGLIFTLNISLTTRVIWDWLGLMPGVELWRRPWTLITSQLIHGDQNHLVGNISVFAPTAIYLAFKGFNFKNLSWVMPFVAMFTWVFGNDLSTHGGFSGVVFFTVSVAILEMFRGSRLKLADAAYAIYALGNISMMTVLLTPLPGISFEGHLAGVIASGIYTFAKSYNIIFALNLTKKH